MIIDSQTFSMRYQYRSSLMYELIVHSRPPLRTAWSEPRLGRGPRSGMYAFPYEEEPMRLGREGYNLGREFIGRERFADDTRYRGERYNR